jgi:hypothetical protein
MNDEEKGRAAFVISILMIISFIFGLVLGSYTECL